MEKKLLVAVVLSVAVMLGYAVLMEKIYGKRQPHFKPAQQAMVAPAARAERSGASPQGTQQTIEAQTIAVKEAIEESIETIETDKFILSFSDVGGALRGIQLKAYKDIDSGKIVELVSVTEPQNGIFNLYSETEPSLPLARYSSRRLNGKLIYSTKLSNGLEIEKTYTISNSSEDIGLDIKISNTTAALMIFNYSIVGPSEIAMHGQQDARTVEMDASLSGEVGRFNISKIKKQPLALPGSADWVAIKSGYFCMVLKPYAASASTRFNLLNNNKIQTLIKSDIISLKGNEASSFKYLLYAGAMEIDMLGSYHLGFEKVINYGFFDWIGKPLLLGLKFIHKLVRNWGLAIIFLTLLVSLLLFPLTLKSLHSMKEMQSLQPKIEALKKELKDSPQKLNKEIMGLYKKHKVNPFGGCLPMVLQMPIFIALYQVLIRSVELKGADFLWIKDLAGPDRILRLPTKLPFLGEWISLLPILAIVVMVLQQKMSQGSKAAMDDTQRMMTMIMPIMFGVIFYNFPSGFLLYFLTSSSFTIAYQLKVKFLEKAEPCVDVRHK